MEIERKFIVPQQKKPDLGHRKYSDIIQGYLSVDPEIRIRKKSSLEKKEYYLTIKSQGNLIREETEIVISENQFEALATCITSNIIKKTRYYIPHLEKTIELDIFYGKYDGLILAEIEFDTEDEAVSFDPPEWFGEEVTNDSKYKNKNMAFR